MKYISLIVILLAIVYFYMMKQENTNIQPYTPKDKATSSSSLSERIKQKPIDTEQKKPISQKISKTKRQTKLDKSQYQNIFSYFSDNGIDIPIDENDIMSFIHTKLKKTKDYNTFVQALLDDFSLLSPEDDNQYIFLGYFDTIKSNVVEQKIFKSLEDSNEPLEKERWSALLASIELKTKEGRDKVTSLLKSTNDEILQSNYISSLANSIVKTKEEKQELQEVLNPYLYDENPALRAAAINRAHQWNDLMKNTKPIEDALSSKDLSVKSAALFTISQTDEVPLKLKDNIFNIMNNDELDYGVRVSALNTLSVFRDKLSDDEMEIVREFGKKFEEL